MPSTRPLAHGESCGGSPAVFSHRLIQTFSWVLSWGLARELVRSFSKVRCLKAGYFKRSVHVVIKPCLLPASCHSQGRGWRTHTPAKTGCSPHWTLSLGTPVVQELNTEVVRSVDTSWPIDILFSFAFWKNNCLQFSFIIIDSALAFNSLLQEILDKRLLSNVLGFLSHFLTMLRGLFL